MRDRQYIFTNITQFTLLNNKLDHLGSNINGFLKRETVPLPFTRIWHLHKKVMFHPYENTECYAVYP
jgi:hypothetical protein